MFMHAARLTTWFTIKMHIFSLDREEIPVERQSLEILLPLFSRQIFPETKYIDRSKNFLVTYLYPTTIISVPSSPLFQQNKLCIRRGRECNKYITSTR